MSTNLKLKLAPHAIALALVVVGTASVATSADAADVCAKQIAAVHKARPGHRKAAARQRLADCRLEHAVSIAPATPLATEPVTVTIHPRWPLRKGWSYRVMIVNEGEPSDPSLEIASKITRSLTVQIGPRDGMPPAAEWQPGEAEVSVQEGTLHQFNAPSGTFDNLAWRGFRFLANPMGG